MLLDFATIALFCLIGTVVVALTLIVGKVLRPHNPYLEKLTTYECGEQAVGSPWVKFNIRFYIFALFFLIFEVEFALIFPAILVFRKWVQEEGGMGLTAFLEIVVFALILILALVYAWRKGDLEWVKSLRE